MTTSNRTEITRGRAARWRSIGTAIALALAGASLAGCGGEQFQKGYILPPGALEQIPIGASQDQVLIVMGTPSTVATLNGEVLYEGPAYGNVAGAFIATCTSRSLTFMLLLTPLGK